MHQSKLVFAQVMAHLPLSTFRRCVARCDGEHKLKSFSCLDQFYAMAFAQLTFRESLRDIEACLATHGQRLYHLGIRSPVAPSTLANANAVRPWQIYADLAQHLIGLMAYRPPLCGALHATGPSLGGSVLVHLAYDLRDSLYSASRRNERDQRLRLSTTAAVSGVTRPVTVAMTPHITVCVCTFKRTDLLKRLLLHLEQQQTMSRFSFAVVVCDNDLACSARAICEEFASRSTVGITYAAESRQNIALARNEALRHARGNFVAFIDDDEFPLPNWLSAMLEACERLGASGVLGPVRPHFDTPPPEWIIKGGFCERPEHPTGREMSWNECRTGNLLFRRPIILELEEPPFKEEFGTGGEDIDFFFRMTRLGHVFRWCNEGIVFETVPENRWTRSYMLKRALLRGRNTLKLPGSHALQLVMSTIAVPAYSIILPFALVVGQHIFMKYCIRFCDHSGRLLAALGMNPVDTR